MTPFRLSCPGCKKRLRRLRAVDWHLPIEQIKWLFVCGHCTKGWLYHPLEWKVTEYDPDTNRSTEAKNATPSPRPG
jgi:hypothetical protein